MAGATHMKTKEPDDQACGASCGLGRRWEGTDLGGPEEKVEIVWSRGVSMGGLLRCRTNPGLIPANHGTGTEGRGDPRPEFRVARLKPIHPSGFDIPSARSDPLGLLSPMAVLRGERRVGGGRRGPYPMAERKIISGRRQGKDDHEDANPSNPAHAVRTHPHILSYTPHPIPVGIRPLTFETRKCTLSLFLHYVSAERR